jgi:hypothetical protein
MFSRKHWDSEVFSDILQRIGGPARAASKHKLADFVECIELSKKVFEKSAKSAAGPFASGYFYINLLSTLNLPG